MADKGPLPVFDGHNDALTKVCIPDGRNKRPFLVQSDCGHVDLPRARIGGLMGGLFAICVPHPDEKPTTQPQSISRKYAFRFTRDILTHLDKLIEESNGQVKIALTSNGLEECLHSNTLAIVIHFEGADAIDPQLETLPAFYGAGLRSLGITWSRSNAFGHGVPFGFDRSPDTGPGLTGAGRELVRVCNKMGIVLDLSHLNENGFRDVSKITDAPLVASHSNAYSLCRCTRNLTDKQLDAIGDSDGIVGINFHISFLRNDWKEDPDTPITEIVRHIDYIAERIGIDHVGFGSDFDGAVMPNELGDVSGLPKLILALREHGYDDSALKKLAYENWLRALRRTWKE